MLRSRGTLHYTGAILPPGMRIQSFTSSVCALAVWTVVVHAVSCANSNELSRRHVTFRSQIQNDTNLRCVADSGVCETTPDVNQYSGYIDVGTNMSMVSMSWWIGATCADAFV